MQKNNVVLTFLVVAVVVLFWMVLGLQSDLQSNFDGDNSAWEWQQRTNRYLAEYR